MRELTPAYRGQNAKHPMVVAEYDPKRHELRGDIEQPHVYEHELFHSLQFLLLPSHMTLGAATPSRFRLSKLRSSKQAEHENRSRDARALEFQEIGASSQDAPLSRAMPYLPILRPKTMLVSAALPLVFAFLGTPAWVALSSLAGGALVSTASLYRRFKWFNQYFGRHGPESLLLIYADPPKNVSPRLLQLKEDEFIARGFLSSNGGLTKAGMGHIRFLVPRTELIRRLKAANRAISGK